MKNVSLSFFLLISILFLSLKGYSRTSFDPCPVNASAGKRAHVKTTQIRKKHSVRRKPHYKPTERPQKSNKPRKEARDLQKSKPAKEHKVKPEREPKPEKQPKVKKPSEPKIQQESNNGSSHHFFQRKQRAVPVYTTSKGHKKNTSKGRSRNKGHKFRTTTMATF